jgi:hypothetical protein
MALWIIGFLFTLGYTGWLKRELPWWTSFRVLVGIFFVWPIYLGMEFGGELDDIDKDDSAGKKER